MEVDALASPVTTGAWQQTDLLGALGVLEPALLDGDPVATEHAPVKGLIALSPPVVQRAASADESTPPMLPTPVDDAERAAVPLSANEQLHAVGPDDAFPAAGGPEARQAPDGEPVPLEHAVALQRSPLEDLTPHHGRSVSPEIGRAHV